MRRIRKQGLEFPKGFERIKNTPKKWQNESAEFANSK